MKLHLPVRLRAALLALCVVCTPHAFSFDDTVFKFEGSPNSETGGGYHTTSDVSVALPEGTTDPTYIDTNLDVGSAIGNYKLTQSLGKAISFDGNTHVKLGDAYWSTGAGALSPSSSFTLTTYVNMSSVTGYSAFFGTGDGSGAGFAFGMKDGKLKVTTKGNTDYILTGMTALNANQWYALAVSYDDTTHIAGFYVDGEFVGSLTLGTGFSNPGGAGAAIGSGSKDTAQDRWTGSMAEFRILSGSSTTRDILAASYLLDLVMWSNGESTNVWNTTSNNWTSDGSSNTHFSTRQWAVFDALKSNTIQVTEDIIAAGMTVAGTYSFEVDAGKTLTTGALEISDDTTVTLGGDGSITINGNVDCIGENKSGILKIAGGTSSVAGAINSALEVTGGTLTGSIVSGDVTVSGGTVTLTGGSDLVQGSSLTVSDGGTLELVATGEGRTLIKKETNININAGGTLKLTGHDSLNWLTGSPSAINLQGESDTKQAVLNINDTTGSNTFSPTVFMNGYSVLVGTKLNSYGLMADGAVTNNLIEASGVGNIVSIELDVRREARLQVAEGGELTISGILANGNADGGDARLVKTGAGTLIITSTTDQTQGFTRGTRVDAGTLRLKDGGTPGTGSIIMAAGTTLETSGNVSLGNTVTGSGKLSVLDGSLTITGSTELGGMVANSGALVMGENGSITFSCEINTANGFEATQATYSDPLASGKNGYESGGYYVVKNSGDSANITWNTSKILGCDVLTDDNGAYIITDNRNSGWYFVNEGKITDDTALTYDTASTSNSAGSNDTAGLVLNGGDLRMESSLNEKAVDGIKVQKDATISVADGVAVDNISLTVNDGVKLTLDSDGDSLKLDAINGTGTVSSVKDLLVHQGGAFTGTYERADGNPVRIGTAADEALQKLRADSKLTVIGTAGTVEVTGLNNAAAADNVLGGIDTTGASVRLDNKTNAGAPTKVTLVNASSMNGGVLEFTVSAEDVNTNLAADKTDKPTVITGEKLDLRNVTLKVNEVDNTGFAYNTDGPEKDILLFVVSDNDDSTVNNVTVDMSGCSWMSKYFTNFRVEQGSINVVADANTSRYAAHGQTPNGTAGLDLAGKAMFRLNPQTLAPDRELAQVLDMLDNHIASGNTGAMDRLGAALAGSSLSAVGLALADDVQRQLRSIRNRTTTMGVNECVVNEDMPYVNGWISGDGNYRQLSESGTDAGYQVSSWGGTVGVDVDVNPNLTLGVAVSALFGDYTGKAADTLTGDLDTQYVSLFARVSTGSWVNTFVGTLGRADVDLERTLPGVTGKTTYKTNGMMFGFLYEIARTFALNDDASTCVQPLFNMSFTHTSLDSATEGGTADTRLTTDSASLTQFSLGLGGRLQSIVGENEYNRASIFEARALLKLDFGDRYNKLNTALAALPNASVGIRSNESGIVGAEVGATLTIPLSQDAGSIFFDVNADFRADQTGVNGSVGYRVNF